MEGRVLRKSYVGAKDGCDRYVFVVGEHVIEAQLHASGRLRTLARYTVGDLEKVLEFLTPNEVDDDWFAPSPPEQLPSLIAERDAYDQRISGLLADEALWLPLHWSGLFLRKSGALGWQSISCGEQGEPPEIRIIGDNAISTRLDDEYFEQPQRTPDAIPSDLLAQLRGGEQVYRENLATLQAGVMGWRIHVDLLVVFLDGDWYNTGFVGDTAVEYTRFVEIGVANLLNDILTSSTQGRANERMHAVSGGQLKSLRAQVRRPPDEIFEELAAGKIALTGGGPTTDMFWSLAKIGERFVQSGGFGELERSADEVRRIVRERSYHSTRSLL